MIKEIQLKQNGIIFFYVIIKPSSNFMISYLLLLLLFIIRINYLSNPDDKLRSKMKEIINMRESSNNRNNNNYNNEYIVYKSWFLFM